MRSVSEKTVYLNNKQAVIKGNKSTRSDDHERFLISINVFGSCGPIRFVVNGDEKAASVIETALKMYAREGRLPILGSDINSFFLYPANAGFDAMKASEAIGSRGLRNFVLCKINDNGMKTEMTTEARSSTSSSVIVGKGSSTGWRVWIQKSLSLKIMSH